MIIDKQEIELDAFVGMIVDDFQCEATDKGLVLTLEGGQEAKRSSSIRSACGKFWST